MALKPHKVTSDPTEGTNVVDGTSSARLYKGLQRGPSLWIQSGQAILKVVQQS